MLYDYAKKRCCRLLYIFLQCAFNTNILLLTYFHFIYRWLAGCVCVRRAATRTLKYDKKNESEKNIDVLGRSKLLTSQRSTVSP